MNSKCEFSYRHYFDVLEIAKKDYAIGPLKDFKKLSKQKKVIILRHDVDVSLEYALKLAKMEANHFLFSTYFVLIQGPLYNVFSEENVSIIQEISKLGHEIGLHYDSMIIPSKPKLLKNIKLMADLLGQIVNKKITSIAQHDVSISPEVSARTSNKYLDAMNPTVMKTTTYISDSVQNWRRGCMCKHVGVEDKLQILTHPIWWSENPIFLMTSQGKLEKFECLKSKKRCAKLFDKYNRYRKDLKNGVIK